MFVLVTRDMDVASERQQFSEARTTAWMQEVEQRRSSCRGNRCESGRLSFGYFSFGEAKKSDSPAGEMRFEIMRRFGH